MRRRYDFETVTFLGIMSLLHLGFVNAHGCIWVNSVGDVVAIIGPFKTTEGFLYQWKRLRIYDLGYYAVREPFTHKRVFVHRLVTEAFLGPRPDGFEVDHINRDKHDNRVENLRYVTHSGNMKNRGSWTHSEEAKLHMSEAQKRRRTRERLGTS